MRYLLFLFLPAATFAATLPEVVSDLRTNPATPAAIVQAINLGQPTAVRDYLAEPVSWSTNSADVVTTNDVTEVAIRSYLKNNKPAGVTASSTPAQVRTAWSAAVAAASSANKPVVLGEQAVWMPAWFLYKTLPDELPSYETNTVVTITATQYRWQALGLTSAPNNNQIENQGVGE